MHPEKQNDLPAGDGIGLPAGPSRRFLKWRLPGILLVALHLVVAWLSAEFEYGGDPLPRPILLFVLIEVLAGAIYLFSALTARNAPQDKSAMAWIIVVGLAMRALLFSSTPIQEDDYYRYLWDGAVTASGINPYSHSPREALEAGEDAQAPLPGLRELADSSGVVAKRINHPELRTIYPPTAQGAFAPAHWLRPWSLPAWRAILFLFDVATLYILILILRSLKLPLSLALIYWWNPILIKEIFNSGHMDLIALPFMLGAILAALRGRHLAGAASLALAVGAKLWPIVLAPLLLRPLIKKPGRLVAAVCVFAALGGAMFLPVYLGGLDGDSGFTAYGQRWELNDALFMLIVWGSKYFMQIVGWEGGAEQFAARVIVAALLAVWIGSLARRESTDGQDLCERCLLAVAALFLLSPTQFPWYYIWMLPLLAIRPRASLLSLTVLLPLYYLRFYFGARDGVGIFDNGIVWIEYAPVWLLLIWEFHKSKWRIGGSATETTS